MDIKESENEKNHIVGIDFGTSWTASLSNKGDRIRFRSIVGYPKDILGKSVIKDDFLIGEKALENRGALFLKFPLKDGVIATTGDQNLDAASEILSYAVSQTNPASDARICCIIGVPSKALAEDKEQILEIAKESCHYATVISKPFLVAFGMDKLMDAMVVDIGAGTVDICGLKGGLPTPEDEVTLLTAGNFIDEVLKKEVKGKYPGVSLTNNLIRKIKEKHSFVGDPAKPVVVDLREKGIPGKYDITSAIKTACECIVPEIKESIVSILSTFDLERQDEVLQNIYIAGGGSRIVGIDKFLEKELEEYGDVRIRAVEDPDFCGCKGALKISDSILGDFME